MQVFLLTNRLSKSDPQYANQVTFGIEAAADRFAPIASTLRAARRLWRPGYRYAKAGVILLEFAPQQELTPSFLPSRDPVRSAKLMRLMDQINQRHGRQTIRPGVVAQKPAWGMRRANLSPSYTTRIDDLLEVKA